MTRKTTAAAKLIPARPAEPPIERVLYCAGQLFLAGFITGAERRKIHQRMMKWVEKEKSK